MAVKRRTLKRKAPLTAEEAAWLIGDNENDGFTLFAGDADYLPNLWRDYGDHARFVWHPGLMHPHMIEAGN